MYENPYMQNFNPYQRPQQPVQIIRVTGIEGAKAYQINAPNSSVALFDEAQDLFYVKSTDGACFPTIRTFKFEPYVEAPQQLNNSQYVTREEFEELKGMIINGKQPIRDNTEQGS